MSNTAYKLSEWCFRPLEDGEMNEMTLPFRHRIQNSSPGGLRQKARYLSVTEVLRNTEYLLVSGEETFCFFETGRPVWGSSTRSPTFLAGNFKHCTKAPAQTHPGVQKVCVVSEQLYKYDLITHSGPCTNRNSV